MEEPDVSKEAAMVVSEIRSLVKDASVSKTLDSSCTCVYINLTTSEDIIMCIRLTTAGYKVVGKRYDTMTDVHAASYESIEQLLTALSPAYRESFSQSLSNKLSQLAEKKTDGDS